MSVAALLDQLEFVRETGPDRWMAKCPAHDDRGPSLSIREVDDKTLVHCFAGCDALDVVHALRLELSDLFEKPLSESDEGRKKGRRRPQPRIPARDILAAIDYEAIVVACITADFLEHRQLDPEIWNRLATAVSRIGAARDMAR